jgi:hypothetical protein
MLVAGAGLGLFALFAAVIAVVTLSGGGDDAPSSTPQQVAVTGTSPASDAAATPPPATSTPASDDTAEENARLVASLQAQLRVAEIQSSGLQERLTAAETALQTANERLASVEADLASTVEERDQLQADLAAAQASLAAANEERLGLLATIEQTRVQVQQTEALAVARGDYASALQTCLDGYKEALSHAVLEDWGGVPISLQNAGTSCSHPPAP